MQIFQQEQVWGPVVFAVALLEPYQTIRIKNKNIIAEKADIEINKLKELVGKQDQDGIFWWS